VCFCPSTGRHRSLRSRPPAPRREETGRKADSRKRRTHSEPPTFNTPAPLPSQRLPGSQLHVPCCPARPRTGADQGRPGLGLGPLLIYYRSDPIALGRRPADLRE
jgi:hypothetical protein